MSPPNYQAVRRRLAALANPAAALHAQGFFKTGPGQYGEGDKFLGIRVPVLRQVAREHRDLPTEATLELLASPLHEERLLALFILVLQYQRGDASRQKAIFELYCDNLRHVNNWDLVDSSAHLIVGDYLRHRNRRLLHRLAKSGNLWERRAAIIATLAYIKERDHDDTLKIAAQLIDDPHDLIHKAVGWMLREVGKRDQPVAEMFLKQHQRQMPRTMLRYAIERFPEPLRKRYLAGTA